MYDPLHPDHAHQRQQSHRKLVGQFETMIDPLSREHLEQLRKANLFRSADANQISVFPKDGSERRGKEHWFTNR